MTDKKPDSRIQNAFVMKNGQKIPIKLRHVSLEEVMRRQASIEADGDTATATPAVEEKATLEAT